MHGKTGGINLPHNSNGGRAVGIVIGTSGGLLVGVVVGVVFSGRIGTAVKSLETTIETKLTAIEAAIKAKI
jgi:ABC-type lipoprotein release transport system permease subunit